MILSVLIPTISSRASTLSRSLWYLQHQTLDAEFEVIVHQGDTVGLGDKINRMIADARGDYIVMVDDDDHLVPHYMAAVLPKLIQLVEPDDRPDFLGYKILALRDGQYWLSIAHDAKNPFGNPTLNRGVCNKMPIRREIAAKVPFGNDYTDDWPWSGAVHALIRTSDFVDDHLYVYDWWPDSMAFRDYTSVWQPHEKFSDQRDIGEWPFDPERVRWL